MKSTLKSGSQTERRNSRILKAYGSSTARTHKYKISSGTTVHRRDSSAPRTSVKNSRRGVQ